MSDDGDIRVALLLKLQETINEFEKEAYRDVAEELTQTAQKFVDKYYMNKSTSQACRACNIREGKPFLCGDCQWAIYQNSLLEKLKLQRRDETHQYDRTRQANFSQIVDSRT